MRIRLFAELANGPLTVQELSDATATTQQNVSKHLGLMHHDGFVSRTPVGVQVVYAIADPIGLTVLEHIADAVARQAREFTSVVDALRADKKARD